MSEFRPRAGQREVLEYQGGKLGISAVPGSGKTRTLAELAARLIAKRIDEGQEVLVVTLVNSAVDNIKSRINQIIKDQGLLANFGYRVRTLHGLSHDIVRERPGLVGLADDFGIIDEREAEAVLHDAAEAWLSAHPELLERFLSPDVEGNRAEWVKRKRWPALVRDVASSFVREAKDQQLDPAVLLEQLEGSPGQAGLGLARMGAEIYADYQRSLAYRGVVDFADLIRLALEAIKVDADYVIRLQQRWPFILEDEAQDSSRLQEELLRRLSGEAGNWVRVGDPNQAIYDSFTNADPRFLRSFLNEQDVVAVTLLESGRSQRAIYELANFLVDWSGQQQGPFNGALLGQHIQPTGPGDSQPNPEYQPESVQVLDREFTPEQELRAVASSVANWLAEPENKELTAAVLVPRNQRGFDLIDLLKQLGADYVELLRSTSSTRQTAGALGNLLQCLANPTSARKLAIAFRVWQRDKRLDPEMSGVIRSAAKRIRSCREVETYLWPRAEKDWIAALVPEPVPQERQLLIDFRSKARHWHRAAMLPIDQLILTLAADLFSEPAELALAYKLAVLLRDVVDAHPGHRLPELADELSVIARNERRFLGFTSEDTGFEPPKGKVTVATMHKAKGLEWDRVYLISVNNYDFPSGMAHDTYLAEPWFIRDNLNLEAEALAQLHALARSAPCDQAAEPDCVSNGQALYTEGQATYRARERYIAERLRLLYVGITRAKRELIITWNKGHRQAAKLQPSVPFLALHASVQDTSLKRPEADD